MRARGFLLVLLILSGCAETPTPTPVAPVVTTPTVLPSTPAGKSAVVTRVIDGDTIEVMFKGKERDIRLIGVDTPETVHPTLGVECFGKKAAAFTRLNLEGQEVELETDVEKLDRYGRLLAYVYVDGEMFNERLIAEGFATVSTFPPNVRYVDRFTDAQKQARKQGRGLWGGCQVEKEPKVPKSGGDCDPAYPDACIPSYPPDLDCPDVQARDFTVRPPDPHGFDSDGDGRGCTSE